MRSQLFKSKIDLQRLHVISEMGLSCGLPSTKNGRTVGKVIVNNMDANLEQVKRGFAWHYKEYAGEQSVADRSSYASAETAAKLAGVGLWRDPKPMPPWEWRHGGKDEPTPASAASGCPCGGGSTCTGPKGGQFCMAPNGKKRYG